MTCIGFIGGGNMSTAIFDGILKSGAHCAQNVWVSGPHLEKLNHWQALGANVTTDSKQVLYNCEIVFLGVKGDKLDEAIKSMDGMSLPERKSVLFITMLAGKKIDTVLQILNNYLSSVCKISLIRIMPNTSITVGEGICLYTPDETVSSQTCQELEKLLSSSALCERVPESLMDTLGALTACGPAFMYVVIEALADGAVKQGVPRNLALRHAAKMLVGSGQMVLTTGKHPGLLKDEVCSPGGSTICGITALENGKLRATLISAIEEASNRNKALGSSSK